MRVIPTRVVAATCLALFLPFAMVGCQLGLGEQRSASPSDNVLAIDRSLTIADITVELSESVGTEDGVDIRHSHGTSDPELALYPVGQPEIANGDEPIARIAKTVAEGSNRFTTSFTWRKRDEGVSDAVDLHMGSFVVSRPSLSGGGQISLGEEYRSLLTANKRVTEVPLASDIFLGGRHFRATEMRLSRDPDSTEFTQFRSHD